MAKNQLDSIKKMFLSKIRSYDILNDGYDNFSEKVNEYIPAVLEEYIPPRKYGKLEFNDGSFSRELKKTEKKIIVYGLICEWISPEILTLDLLRQNYNSKDWDMTSQANHLSKLLTLEDECKSKFSYWRNRIGYIAMGEEDE